MSDRLPAKLEVAALIRQAESNGGFASVIRRGDAHGGTIVLAIAERGAPVAQMERRLGDDFTYRWAVTERANASTPDKFRNSIDDRARFDPDFWLIELDIPDAERFIAETTGCT